jgi:hypothetical protein
MSETSKTVQNTINNIMNMKESTTITILTFITLIIIVLSFIYYFYYSGTIFSVGLRTKECNNMEILYGSLNGKIRSIDNKFEYTLKDYYIKSAYNACSGGNYKNDYVDICILKNLLKQGVRGLDFEIFSIDDNPVVATSTSDNYYIKETFNVVSFSNIMKVISNYAFSGSTSPNPFDPIIIHLRFKTANPKMYKNMAKTLENYNSILLDKKYSYEYQGKNLGNVKLTDLMGKVVIIVDKTNNSFLESPEFYEYVNMTSNSMFMRALHYYDIAYTPDINELIEFNKLGMTIGMPDKGANPVNPSGIVLRETGVQMLAMRYQYIDANIEENDAFFNENGYAFVLKPENLRYKPLTIEAPPPQNPEVSYATRTVESDYYKFDI